MTRLAVYIIALFVLQAAAALAQTADTVDFPKTATNSGTEEKRVLPSGGAVYNDGKIDYVSTGVRFSITAKDGGSGVRAVYCALDQNTFSAFSQPVSATNEGLHTILYRAEDNVGNLSAVQCYRFFLDLTPPSVLIAPDIKPFRKEDAVYAGSNAVYRITAYDGLSGVRSVHYAVDDGAEALFQNGFIVNGTNGVHKISFWAEDNVGNVSEKSAYFFFLDVNPPAVKFAVNPAPYETNGVKYISPGSAVSIEAVDGETGVLEVQYSVDGGSYSLYTGGAISLPGGAHTIKARARDLPGNWSGETVLSVTVDAVLPEADLGPVK